MRIRIPLFSSLVLFSLTAAGTAGAAPATILPGFTSPATLEFANAANTVPLFDDFDGTDFDASIWDARVEDAEATVTVADGVVTVVDPIDPVDARQGALRMFSELSFDAPSFSMSLDVTAHSGDFTSSLGSERVSGDDDNSNASLEANVSVNTDGFGPQVHLRVSYREGYYDEVLDEFVEVVDESESLQLPAPPSTPYTVTLTYDAVTETGTATLDAADGSFEISLTNVPAMAAYRARVDVGSHDSGGGTVEFTRFHASNLFLPARYTASAAPLTAQGTDYSFIDFDGEPLGPGDLFLGDDFTSVFADDTPVGIDGGDDGFQPIAMRDGALCDQGLENRSRIGEA